MENLMKKGSNYMGYSIEGNFTNSISNVNHIGLSIRGYYYSVIFGENINGGFYVIPNWNCGGELAELTDTLWNTESINKSLKSKKISKEIAQAICDYTKNKEIKEMNK